MMVSMAWSSSAKDSLRNTRAAGECSENEVYVTCRSSSCFDMTCDHILKGESMRMCTRDCKEGCACEKGYVRNEAGVCISDKLCFIQ